MATHSTSATSDPLRGIFWMLVTGLLFVAVTGIVKHLDGALPAAEAAFLRYALGLGFLIPMIRPILAARLTRRQIRLFGLRGVIHSAAIILWFFAMSQIPIVEVTALNYLSPVYVTLGAGLFLGEALTRRRLVAIFVALIGAMIILRPGFRTLEPGHIAMLGTGLLFGAGYLLAKVLSDETPAIVVVGMLSITVTIALIPFAVAVWVPPTIAQLGWLFLLSIIATAGHYTMTLAFAAAPVTITQPVSYLQLIWASLLGVLLFGEPLEPWVIVGAAIIMLAVTFITWRETVARRAERSPKV